MSDFEETEDLSDYDDEEYDEDEDASDEDLAVEYEGFLEFDENWNQIEEVDDYQYLED